MNDTPTAPLLPVGKKQKQNTAIPRNKSPLMLTKIMKSKILFIRRCGAENVEERSERH